MPDRITDPQTLENLLRFQEELISCEPDLGTLIDLVARRSQELCGAAGAAVELSEDDEMVYRAVSGTASGQLGLRIPRAGSFSGLAVTTRTPQICDDSEHDDRVNRAACRAVGLRSMVVQPLFRGETLLGIVKVMSPEVAAFGHPTVQILAQLSKTVAGVLANAIRWDSMKSDNENLVQLASHDSLTGVRNRSAFYDSLRRAIGHARRSRGKVGVALFDLDGLKSVNDTHGHQAGDYFIRSFAERLSRRLRESDTVARLGGDEFGVVFPLESEISSVEGLGRQWANEVGGPLRFGDTELSLAASAGTSLFDDDGVDAEGLVAQADARLYQDKRARKTRPQTAS